jgi:hypothetical protein
MNERKKTKTDREIHCNLLLLSVTELNSSITSPSSAIRRGLDKVTRNHWITFECSFADVWLEIREDRHETPCRRWLRAKEKKSSQESRQRLVKIHWRPSISSSTFSASFDSHFSRFFFLSFYSICYQKKIVLFDECNGTKKDFDFSLNVQEEADGGRRFLIKY